MGCLYINLFLLTAKITSKHRITGPFCLRRIHRCFASQKASDADNFSMSGRQDDSALKDSTFLGYTHCGLTAVYACLYQFCENAGSMRGIREYTVSDGFPSQRASNIKLWYFLCWQPEEAVKPTVDLLMISDTLTPIWCHCNIVQRYHFKRHISSALMEIDERPLVGVIKPNFSIYIGLIYQFFSIVGTIEILFHLWDITFIFGTWTRSLVIHSPVLIIAVMPYERRGVWNHWKLVQQCVQDSNKNIPGARPTDGISIKFELQSKFGVLWFKTISTDHSEIFAHVTTVTLSWCVQIFVVIGRICYEQGHYKRLIEFRIWSKYRLWDGRQVSISGRLWWESINVNVFTLKWYKTVITKRTNNTEHVFKSRRHRDKGSNV